MTTLSIHRPHKPPPTLRLARRIHERLTERSQSLGNHFHSSVENLRQEVESVSLRCRQLDLCRRHHLTSAQPPVMLRLRELLHRLPATLRQVEISLPKEPRLVLSEFQIAQELDQLEEEFGGWKAQGPTVSVTTNPIVLKDIELGRFEICLDLSRLASSDPFRVVALDPNPASSNSQVTHPHVRSEELCQGDALGPLRAALESGRLSDFFLIVRSVLTTYNASSPYVALDHWSGSPCHDCGDVMEGMSSCSGCNHDFCDSCLSYCRACDTSLCLGCLENCPSCDQRTCSDCMERCQDCDDRCCRSCLHEDRCSSCHEKLNHKEPCHEPTDVTAKRSPSGTGLSEPASPGDAAPSASREYVPIRRARRLRHRHSAREPQAA